MVADGQSLLLSEGQDLFEDGPPDSFSTRRRGERAFVRPVGAFGHSLEELGNVNVRDGPFFSLFQFIELYCLGAILLHEEGLNEFVVHSTT